MNFPLLSIIRNGIATQKQAFPNLPDEAEGLPGFSKTDCNPGECGKCAALCPAKAISCDQNEVKIDRGLCIGCSICFKSCPSGVIINDRSTTTAVFKREDLIISNKTPVITPAKPLKMPFRKSLHVREVSTGDNITDFEAVAASNPVFDMARYGIQVTASPRFADALLVTGPVGKAMQEPLRRCREAMAEPAIVIAAGTSAISGGLFAGGYAEANGVDSILPVSCYIPGDPPHPWSIIYGILLAMGRISKAD
ncbi:MAG: 4Fe-4S binding protein [Firmicutes bacterium]|nr:4Fe-4S binding protein [Bacillota bacterium]